MVFHYEPKFACSHCEHKTHRKFDLDKHLKTHGKKNNKYFIKALLVELNLTQIYVTHA